MKYYPLVQIFNEKAIKVTECNQNILTSSCSHPIPRSNTGIKKKKTRKEFTTNMCTLQGNLLLLREMVRSFFLTKIAD